MSVASRNGHQNQRQRKVMISDLNQLMFAPKVVALIGVSNDPKKLSARPLQFCQQQKFAGKLYLVNPRHDQVLGQPAFSSVSKIPDKVDHAYFGSHKAG